MIRKKAEKPLNELNNNLTQVEQKIQSFGKIVDLDNKTGNK